MKWPLNMGLRYCKQEGRDLLGKHQTEDTQSISRLKLATSACQYWTSEKTLCGFSLSRPFRSLSSMTTKQPKISACCLFISSQAAYSVPATHTYNFSVKRFRHIYKMQSFYFFCDRCSPVRLNPKNMMATKHLREPSPPVARRSSISTIFCLGATASSWISASACKRRGESLEKYISSKRLCLNIMSESHS